MHIYIHIQGVGSGVGMVVVPVYLGEIAPPTLRGTLGTFTQFAIVIGKDLVWL
ncbi:hypothetical protein EON63_24195 [archaeon]|nr:MAG: hypothetical protein EON63_24195 [archaeon]